MISVLMLIYIFDLLYSIMIFARCFAFDVTLSFVFFGVAYLSWFATRVFMVMAMVRLVLIST